MANINELIQEINTNLPTNNKQKIKAQNIRETLIDELYETTEIYDVSINNHEAKYADISAAIGSDGANIPENIRKGGMEIRFINSSTDKYEQWTYIGTSTTTEDFSNISNWQPNALSLPEIDDEPTAGSDNLAKSGGIYYSIYSQYDCTDNIDANTILVNAIMRDTRITKICFTIGNNNDLTIIFRDSNNNQLSIKSYTSVNDIDKIYTFMSNYTTNIIILDINVLKKLLTDNYGKSNYDICGNLTSAVYDDNHFYLYRNVSDKMMTAMGYGWTDNTVINNILPYAALTSDVKKISVRMDKSSIYISLINDNDTNLLGKTVYDTRSDFNTDEIEMQNSMATTLTDGLIKINKSAIDRVRERYVVAANTTFVGTIINNLVYNFDDKSELFGVKKRFRDWGTTGSAVSSADPGRYIYNTVDCFRFPTKITNITIPAKKDGVVGIYRTKITDGVGSSTILLATVNVKKGTFKYPVDIDLNVGEGIGLQGQGIISTATTNSWKFGVYDTTTLTRQVPASGAGPGAVSCSVEYYYFAPKTAAPLKDVKISVLGDGISTFGTAYSYSDPYYSTMGNGYIYNAVETWWGRLVEDGAVILKNMSMGGSTFTNKTGNDAQRWIGYNARITNLKGANNEIPDVILVLCGINDLSINAALGDFDFTKKITNYSGLDTFSFKQALQYVVMKLIELYPSSKIILGTPFKVGNSTWNFPEQNGARYLYQICDAIRDISKIMGVGLIDFYSEVQISYPEMKDLKYGNDIHPDKLAHYLYYQIAKKHLLDMNYQKIY